MTTPSRTPAMDDVTKALERLEQKWRAMNESVPGNEFSQGIGQALAMCADELATLRQSLAGQGEVEPVARLTVYADTNAFTARIHDVAHDLAPGTYDLYTTPRAAEAVTDAQVEAFARVYWKGDWPFKPDTEANRELMAEFRDVIKRGLTAALTPPSAKGENSRD